jgi:hypothetical protein
MVEAVWRVPAKKPSSPVACFMLLDPVRMAM